MVKMEVSDLEDLLTPIRNAESEADEKIRNAGIASREKIAAVRAEAQAMAEERLRENRLEYNRLMQQFEDEGQKLVQEIQNDIQNQCKELTDKASAKIDMAANKILERIVS